ncbi:MAG: 3-phosphoglycerate dehydrogenase [Bacteroidales bacterium]|nr:3-phosphoglycerate dehydrogenase [Bacteroidales bacterium]
MKILVATEKPFSKTAVDNIREVVRESGNEFLLLEKYTDKSDLLNAVKDVEALIVRSDIVDDKVIEAGKKLKIVVRAGAGYDNIDLKAASAKKIVVMNTPGQNSNAVAELVFGMMILMNRKNYSGATGEELRGKKIGIHAYGYVGRIVGLIAKGFGMKVYAFDPFVEKVMVENDGVKWEESAESLYSKCQYISLHLPANNKTIASINYDLLKNMPEGATVINTARKEVIDEDGLLRMFQIRKDFRYLSDIAPDNAEILLRDFSDRCFLTPKKMGAQTAEANLNSGVAAATQIVNFIDNGDVKFQVNKF